MTNWTLLSLLSIGHGICPGEEFYAISKETHHSVHCKLSSDYDRVIVLSDDDEKDVIYGIIKMRRKTPFLQGWGYKARLPTSRKCWRRTTANFRGMISLT